MKHNITRELIESFGEYPPSVTVMPVPPSRQCGTQVTPYRATATSTCENRASYTVDRMTDVVYVCASHLVQAVDTAVDEILDEAD